MKLYSNVELLAHEIHLNHIPTVTSISENDDYCAASVVDNMTFASLESEFIFFRSDVLRRLRVRVIAIGVDIE